ncbi:hypothetical protein DL98DRAFT_149636 [Cadophora sp. DSE1049]|nr:hypothetical protein DL98DRAFT_149636 [Cadophora sp. DSE1049]
MPDHTHLLMLCKKFPELPQQRTTPTLVSRRFLPESLLLLLASRHGTWPAILHSACASALHFSLVMIYTCYPNSLRRGFFCRGLSNRPWIAVLTPCTSPPLPSPLPPHPSPPPPLGLSKNFLAASLHRPTLFP